MNDTGAGYSCKECTYTAPHLRMILRHIEQEHNDSSIDWRRIAGDIGDGGGVAGGADKVSQEEAKEDPQEPSPAGHSVGSRGSDAE